MAFKFKALVAAAALAAIAGQASAALTLPTASTPSDLLFYAYNLSSGNSFVFDLGSGSGVSTLNQDITGSAWTSYMTAEGGDLSSTTWGLAYAVGSNAATSLWGTTVTAGAAIDSESSTKMSSGRTVMINYLKNTALTGAGQSDFETGSASSNFQYGFSNSWGGNAVFTTDNAVGTAASFYTVTAATSAAGGTLIASGIKFDGTTVAAVPEPESYAMMAAGLLMIGAIARRRRSV